MFAQILLAIKSIASIISTVKEIFKFIEDNKTEKWFQDSAEVFGKLKEAKTTDERKALAKDLRNLLGGL